MRNAIDIGDGFVVTTDNSGGIGEKVSDVVTVPDAMTAYFAARVALLEQWAVQAEPIAVLLYNFSGGPSWNRYVQGVTDLFHEAGIELPQISGSTETNMELLQSAVAVTMIGKRKTKVYAGDVQWFSYGIPLVGQEMVENQHEVASIKRIHEAMTSGIVQRVWPVGSQGILAEVRVLTANSTVTIDTVLNSEKSAGPSTVVLVGVLEEKKHEAQEFFGPLLHPLHII